MGRGRCFPGFSQGSRTGDDKDMENTKYKVLLVEDDDIDQMAFERLVKEEGLLYDYTICSSAAEAENVLSSTQFDVIITDYILGDGTAFDIFDLIEDTPIIVITGAGDEGIAVEAMKAGKPVIGSRSGGTVEQIADGFNGLFYKPRDCKELATKIKHLHDHPNLAQKMGKNGLHLALEFFNHERYRKEIAKILSQ